LGLRHIDDATRCDTTRRAWPRRGVEEKSVGSAHALVQLPKSELAREFFPKDIDHVPVTFTEL
jgi:hypothetical protein